MSNKKCSLPRKSVFCIGSMMMMIVSNLLVNFPRVNLHTLKLAYAVSHRKMNGKVENLFYSSTFEPKNVITTTIKYGKLSTLRRCETLTNFHSSQFTPLASN